VRFVSGTYEAAGVILQRENAAITTVNALSAER
jgi:hypothetical protein